MNKEAKIATEMQLRIMFFWRCSLECARHIEILEDVTQIFMKRAMGDRIEADLEVTSSALEKGYLQ